MPINIKKIYNFPWNNLSTKERGTIMKYQKNFTVTSARIDATSIFSITGIFEVLEECVTEYYGAMNIDGFTFAEKYNTCWVFTKNKIRILAPLNWKDEFTAEAFISKKSVASLSIDVALRNSNGDLCVYAKIKTVPLDLATGRLRKLDTLGIDDSFEVFDPLTDLAFTKFPKVELPEVDQVTIKYINIDYLQHTNNKEYAKFILNTYEVKDILERPIHEMEIHYLGQAHEHDVLSIRKDVLDSKELFSIVKDDQTLINCAIVR